MRFRPELALVCLLFLTLPSRAAQAAPVVVERLEASVNSSLILLSDILKFRETLPLRAQLDPLFAGTSLAAKGANSSDADIVAFLIDERIIGQQFPVNDAEVEQEINSIQATNKLDRTALRRALGDQGFVFDDYFELIRTSAAKRNLIDRDIRTKVTISDDDVKNYFYNHFSRANAAPSAYHVKIITISPKTYKTPAAARDAANRARQAVEAGETFEEVAKRMSDDGSASAGGDLGTLTEDQMSPAIRNELKKLKLGQVSAVLGNPQGGFFFVKLTDVKTTDSDRYEKMKDEIRNQLAAAEYQHQIFLWLERQRQTAFIHRAGEPSVAGLHAATP